METRLAALIHSGFWRVLDWVYPPVCVCCAEPGYLVCEGCLGKIQFIRGGRCVVCGAVMAGSGERCSACRTQPPTFAAVRSLGVYAGVLRDCIHALKYENTPGLGEFFSPRLAELVREVCWTPELVIPVPLSHKRFAARGYNQAACIAKPVAARLGVRYHPYGLERTRDTASQVGLSAVERRANVAGAFKALPELVVGKQVLVVDDVMTTGSTLEACAQALRAAGSMKVYGLTLGRFNRHARDGDFYDPASCIIESTN